MLKKITASDLAQSDAPKIFDVPVPPQCPRCNTAIDTRPLRAFYLKQLTTSNDTLGRLFVFYFCTHCQGCFIGTYNVSFSSLTAIQLSLDPKTIKNTTVFPDSVCEISPDFVKLYQQSEIAELNGLNEICGMGYRKALEFLVKDFAIYEHPNKAEKIAKTSLSQCITTYIKDPQIQDLAKASAWLGNDETHYSRQHDDYNFSDFKAFLDATVAAINYTFAYKKAKTLLSTPK